MTTNKPLHPRLEELLAYIDQERAVLRTAVHAVPQELWTERPEAERWSVAEVLEHLVIVERRLAAMFAMRFAEARANGVGPDAQTGPVLPTLDVARMRERRTRFRTNDASSPKGAMTVPEALAALDDALARIRSAVATGNGLALDTVVQPHQALGTMNMYQWIAFAGAHEARHADQIREIAAALSARA